jgi:hypothetical protein
MLYEGQRLEGVDHQGRNGRIRSQKSDRLVHPSDSVIGDRMSLRRQGTFVSSVG